MKTHISQMTMTPAFSLKRTASGAALGMIAALMFLLVLIGVVRKSHADGTRPCDAACKAALEKQKKDHQTDRPAENAQKAFGK